MISHLEAAKELFNQHNLSPLRNLKETLPTHMYSPGQASAHVLKTNRPFLFWTIWGCTWIESQLMVAQAYYKSLNEGAAAAACRLWK